MLSRCGLAPRPSCPLLKNKAPHARWHERRQVRGSTLVFRSRAVTWPGRGAPASPALPPAIRPKLPRGRLSAHGRPSLPVPNRTTSRRPAGGPAWAFPALFGFSAVVTALSHCGAAGCPAASVSIYYHGGRGVSRKIGPWAAAAPPEIHILFTLSPLTRPNRRANIIIFRNSRYDWR